MNIISALCIYHFWRCSEGREQVYNRGNPKQEVMSNTYSEIYKLGMIWSGRGGVGVVIVDCVDYVCFS